MNTYPHFISKLAISAMDRQALLRGVPQTESPSHTLPYELCSMESYPQEGRPKEQIRHTELLLG